MAGFNELGYVKGRIADAGEFSALGPRFEKAFAFLRRPDLRTLPPGRYGIDGEDVYASVAEITLKEFNETALCEAHDEYVDVQAPLSGPETIGVAKRPLNPVVVRSGEDIVFFEEKCQALALRPGEFAILDTNCAHAPGLSTEGAARHRKVVVKVRK